MRRILKEYPNMLVEKDHMDSHWMRENSLYKNVERVDKENEMEYFVALLYLDKMIRERS